MDWNGDNAGPPSVEQVINAYNKTSYNFPNATNIHKSSFTETKGEIGDSWNFGIQSDPYKIAAHRIAQRMRTKCLQSMKCNLDDKNFYNFSRLLFKNGECTFSV